QGGRVRDSPDSNKKRAGLSPGRFFFCVPSVQIAIGMSEPDVSDLMTVQQAIAILDAAPVTTRTKRIPLREALGHCVAQEIVADRDYPPFDKSLMDGFAVGKSGPGDFTVVGE